MPDTLESFVAEVERLEEAGELTRASYARVFIRAYNAHGIPAATEALGPIAIRNGLPARLNGDEGAASDLYLGELFDDLAALVASGSLTEERWRAAYAEVKRVWPGGDHAPFATVGRERGWTFAECPRPDSSP